MLSEIPFFVHRYCDKAFKQCNNRQRHEQTHVPEKRFRCETCYQYFSSCSELKEHILTHEVSDGKPFRCHVCVRGFARKKSLRSHINVVHMNPKHRCDICGERFHSTREAKKHAKMHPVESGELEMSEIVVEGVEKDNVQNVSLVEEGGKEGGDEEICQDAGGETVEQSEDDVMIVDGEVEVNATGQGSGTRAKVKRGRGRPKKKGRGAKGITGGGNEAREMVTTENNETQTNYGNKKSRQASSNERENDAGSQVEDCSLERTDRTIPLENGILNLRNNSRNTADDIEVARSETGPRNNQTNSDEAIRKILEGKPFICPVCDKGYASKSGLKHHHDTTHKNDSTFKDHHLYYCHECKEGFKSKRRFWLHDVKVHGLLNTSESDNEINTEEDARDIGAQIIRNARDHSSTPTDTESLRVDMGGNRRAKVVSKGDSRIDKNETVTGLCAASDDGTDYVDGKRVRQRKITDWFGTRTK